MFDCDLDAIRKIQHDQSKRRITAVEKRERLATCVDGCGCECVLIVLRKTRSLSCVTQNRLHTVEQVRIVVESKFDASGLSVHYFLLNVRRTLRGNPGNSTDRQRRAEYYAASGKSNNTSRKCIASPASHTASKRLTLRSALPFLIARCYGNSRTCVNSGQAPYKAACPRKRTRTCRADCNAPSLTLENTHASFVILFFMLRNPQ